MPPPHTQPYITDCDFSNNIQTTQIALESLLGDGNRMEYPDLGLSQSYKRKDELLDIIAGFENREQ